MVRTLSGTLRNHEFKVPICNEAGDTAETEVMVEKLEFEGEYDHDPGGDFLTESGGDPPTTDWWIKITNYDEVYAEIHSQVRSDHPGFVVDETTESLDTVVHSGVVAFLSDHVEDFLDDLE